MRKLVTHFSLRLGLELLGKENCIELRQILWGCKRRNPQNLAGSVPDVPTSANILTQKKEQKSLLLKFVIPAGFEPTTHSLEGCCSIQLSYGTIVLNISNMLKWMRKSNIFFLIFLQLINYFSHKVE